MSGDNTKWQKLRRARNRVFESIIEKDSMFMIDEAYRELTELLNDNERVTLDELIRDANNYIITIQAGHSVILSKTSPYARKFIAETEEAERRNEDAKLMKRMMEHGRNHAI